jgi:plastocyanin domain-containing protein
MNKTALIIITIGLVLGIGIIFIGSSKTTQKNNDGNTVEQVNNVEVKDGIQYITINVKGGYSPRVSNAKSGIPTKLILKTNGTYDCSSAVIIRSLKYQKILPKTGEEIVDLGTPSSGEPIQGICGMGMYNFLINFS